MTTDDDDGKLVTKHNLQNSASAHQYFYMHRWLKQVKHSNQEHFSMQVLFHVPIEVRVEVCVRLF